jgi:hypothetical protein
METTSPLDDLRDERALAGLCAALGAAAHGGKLDAGEVALLSDATEVPAVAIAEARSRIAAGSDPLGEVFSRVRPAVSRRELGAFYTPPQIVDSMLTWALSHVPARVVDPGCGSGRYAVGR